MRLNSFGLMVGGGSVVVAIRLALYMVAGLGLVLAQQDAASKPKVGATPLTAEQLAVYRAVLHDWVDDGKSAVNLSIQTVPLDLDGPLGAKGCGKEMDLESLTPAIVHRFRMEDLPQIGSDKLRLVDPDKQAKQIKQNDPGKKIREGVSVDEAVRNGFAHGLVTLSEVQFDKKHEHAIVSYGFRCGGRCGNGGTAIIEKKDGQWQRMSGRKGVCGEWVS